MRKEVIGNATLYLGDCMDYMKGCEDNAFDLVFTSPPYNMRTRIRNGEYTTRETKDHFSKKYKNFHDALSIDDYYKFHKQALIEMLRISNLVLWNIQIVTGSKEAVFKLIGFFGGYIKDIIIWDKGHGQPAMHDKVLNKATELIIIFESPKSAGRYISNAKFKRGELSDIWRIKREASAAKGHSAVFPLNLCATVLNNFADNQSKVLDPFLGTGTSAIAAHYFGCEYVGIEIDEDYFNAAVRRFEKETAQSDMFGKAAK